ncbi:uncharacterized protein [Procambarus clarkii]|uniref:uncharacterized protein isoform X2 n=1 Tax=Procambarus clarkii TaxID=6728 RepID=UPI0037429A26
MARRGCVQVEQPQLSQISYLQPEILPVEVMLDVLKKRGIKSANLHQAERAHIITLFHKYVSPKHQREYRDNRRGKILTKMRRKLEKDSGEEDWKKLVMESKDRSSLISSTNVVLGDSAARERLKPPPSTINSDRKKIKLAATANTSGTTLDFIVIKRRSSEDSELSSSNKLQRLPQEEKSQNKRKDSEECQKEAKKIKLVNGQEKSTSEGISSEDEKKLKSERKPISWP